MVNFICGHNLSEKKHLHTYYIHNLQTCIIPYRGKLCRGKLSSIEKNLVIFPDEVLTHEPYLSELN